METVKGPDSPERMLEHMVDLYQLPLLRLCYAYLHDEELAKDSVQEIFIKAYRNLNRFDRRSSEKTWLNRIAINTCKDMCKSGWFRHVDRRITPDMLPETETRPEEKDESLTVAIMELPVKLREVASCGKSRCFAGSRVLRIWKRLKPWEYPIRLSAAV